MKKILLGLCFCVGLLSSVGFGAYCTPTYSLGGIGGDYIAGVYLENLSNPSGPTIQPAYTFYNALTIPNIATGESYIFTGTVGTYPGIANRMFAWIDFNQDEVFDGSEMIGQFGPVVGNTTSAFSFTVPANALTGQTRMRVIEHYILSSVDPCEVESLGEGEDYLVNIIAPPITITGPETGLVQFKGVGATFSLTGSLDYALTTGNVCNNTLSFTGYTSTIFFSDTYDGAGYQMCFRGIDAAAGHTYYAVSDVIDNIDTTPPTIVSVNSGYTHFKSGSVILSWDVFDTNGLTGVGLSYKLTSDPGFANTIVQGGLINGTGSSEIGSGDLSSRMLGQPDGQYYILFTATDVVGNIATGGYSFIYDTTPPTLQYTGTIIGNYTLTTSNVSGNALYAYFTDTNLSGGISIFYVGNVSGFAQTRPVGGLYNGGTNLVGTGLLDTFLFFYNGTGDYYRYAEVSDEAGNVTTGAQQVIHVVAPTTTTTTTTSHGGGGGLSLNKDDCPNGDLTNSYYDGQCGTTQLTTGTANDSGNTGYQENINTGSDEDVSWTDEMRKAYHYAFAHGITTMPTIEKANMFGILKRGEMAKMIVNYAINQMKKKPDTSRVCTFSDVSNESEEIQGYITKACQLGIMGIDIDAFRPQDSITRGEFGTVLSRVLWDARYNRADPFYIRHLKALKDTSIMNDISNPSMTEVRGYVMIMMMRASTIPNMTK